MYGYFCFLHVYQLFLPIFKKEEQCTSMNKNQSIWTWQITVVMKSLLMISKLYARPSQLKDNLFPINNQSSTSYKSLWLLLKQSSPAVQLSTVTWDVWNCAKQICKIKQQTSHNILFLMYWGNLPQIPEKSISFIPSFKNMIDLKQFWSSCSF